MKIKFPELKIGNLITKLPIVQGGMGVGISLSGLASAVANEGGIGVLSAVGLGALKGKIDKNVELEALREEIRKAKSMTNGVLGLNVMVALTNFDEMVTAALEEKIDILFFGAGLPLKMPSIMDSEFMKTTKTKFAVIVSSARAVNVIFKTWAKKFSAIPDAVVVEGPKAGGHLGFHVDQLFDPEYQLEALVPQVKEAITPWIKEYNKEIPLIAAGGIYTGGDIHNIMKLGANAVQMGTRFVTTEECDASEEFKQSYLDATEDDITIINSPVGLPGRALKNSFLESVRSGKKIPFSCPWKCLKTCDYKKSPYCIAAALLNAKLGHLDNGFAFAGANAYLTEKIVSVHELIETLKQEYHLAVSADLP